MSAVLDAALRHAANGRPVFPCRADSKAPATPHGFRDATTDASRIRAWFAHAAPLLAIPTGSVSRLVVIDTDGDEGCQSLRSLERQHGPLPRTASVVTPSGGAHFYFRHPGVEVPCSVSRLAPSIDVRGDGGYVIVPPSVMADGRRYDVDENRAPAAMPAWLLALTVAETTDRSPAPAEEWLAIVRDGVDGPQGSRKGARNDSLARLTGHLLRRYVDPQLVLELAQLVNETRFRPPLPSGDVETIVDSIAGRELRRRARLS